MKRKALSRMHTKTNKYKTQAEKYEYISKQHGGYYRHNFTDHAYLYNLYFPPNKQEFEDSCEKVKADRDLFYEKLSVIEGMTAYKPDANYIFCRLPDDALSGPEVTKRLFIEHNIYIKDSAGKTQPEATRYIRIASRTNEENSKLIAAMKDIMYLSSD